MSDDPHEIMQQRLAEELERATEGMSALATALLLAEALRNVFGKEYVIEADATAFTVRPK
jgi:hypothetical protein